MKTMLYSELYQRAIKAICEKTGISVEDDYDEAESDYDTKCLRQAHLETADILDLLQSEYSGLVKFSIQKLLDFGDSDEDNEYPVGEEPELDDENDSHVYEGGNVYCLGFLLGYATEYYLLKFKPAELIIYLKAIKMPHARQYVKELEKIYNSI